MTSESSDLQDWAHLTDIFSQKRVGKLTAPNWKMPASSPKMSSQLCESTLAARDLRSQEVMREYSESGRFTEVGDPI